MESYGQILEETIIENLAKTGKMCKMDSYKGTLQFCTGTKKFLSTVNLLILVYKIILVSFDLYYYINTARTATGYIGQFF